MFLKDVAAIKRFILKMLLSLRRRLVRTRLRTASSSLSISSWTQSYDISAKGKDVSDNEDSESSDSKPFNAASFLMVSHRLARKVPDSRISQLILQ
jgi:hypothetical protein